jgi:hypothetical protein
MVMPMEWQVDEWFHESCTLQVAMRSVPLDAATVRREMQRRTGALQQTRRGG